MESELAKIVRPNRSDPERMIRSADEAVGRLRDDYVPRLLEDVRCAGKILHDTREGQVQPKEALAEIHNIVHETAGLAGTFGYPRISEVAHSLCKLLRDPDKTDDRCLSIVRLHVDTLGAVLDERRDSNATIDEMVVSGLRQAVSSIVDTENK